MINLGLNVIKKCNQTQDIVIRPYEFSYEELVDIINKQDDAITMLEFEQFCNTFDKELNEFENILVLNNYINIHGVDHAVEELFGSNEGLVEGVKNALVSFVKWLWKKLKELCSWVKKLFTINHSSKQQGPIGVANILIYGTTADRTEELKKLKSIIDTHNRSVSIPYNLSKCCKSISNVRTRLSQMLIEGFSIIHDEQYKTSLSTQVSNAIHDLKRIKSDLLYSRDQAISLLDNLTTIAQHIHTHGAALLTRIDKLQKLPDGAITEKEAKKYLTMFADAFGMKGTSLGDPKESFGTLKTIIAQIRTACAGCYRINRACVDIAKNVVSQLATTEKYSEQIVKETAVSFRNLDGGVDVHAKLPQDLTDRINDAWGVPINIRRIYISNTRDTRTNNSGSGVKGSALKVNHSKIFQQVESALPTNEIVINYGAFKDKLRYKTNTEAYRTYLIDKRIDPVLNNISLEEDNVKGLLVTIIHESRHIYQYTYKKYLADIDKEVDNNDPHRHQKYLDLEHEKDARQAAKDFKFKSADVKWVTELLIKCIRQELTNLLKYKKVSK